MESRTARRLDQLRRDLAQLDGFPERHPDVKRLKDEIAALEADVQSAPAQATAADAASAVRPGARTLESLNTEIERLRREEEGLRKTIATVEQRLEEVPYRENELALILRDQQAAKELYSSLLKRYEDAQLAQSMEAANQGERFRILEPAVAPMGPSAPNRFRLLAMGVLLATLLTSIAVLIREQFDTSFHTVDDVRQFTRVPVLVLVPCIEMPVSKRAPTHGRCDGVSDRRARAGRRVLRLRGEWQRAVGPVPCSRRVARDATSTSMTRWSALRAPDSFAAEQYQALRLKIEWLRRVQNVHVLAISSPGLGEGKTVTAINLAGAHAECDRVLLIDADLRRPSVGSQLRLDEADAPGSRQRPVRTISSSWHISFAGSTAYLSPSSWPARRPRRFTSCSDRLGSICSCSRRVGSSISSSLTPRR